MEAHYCDCCHRPIKPDEYYYQVGIMKRQMKHSIGDRLNSLQETLQERAVREDSELQTYKTKEICCSCNMFFQIIAKLRLKEEKNLLHTFEKAMEQRRKNGKTDN